ncbi:MAG: DUF1501 domain-containing protein [Opitutae bacterium]|nr:DUF1501 domain-containing protein [Opitutae bacterium]
MSNHFWRRRSFLRSGLMGLGYSAAMNLIYSEEMKKLSSSVGLTKNKQRAKRILFLFMKGGPSQVDTFDYKPRLQYEHGNPLPFQKPKIQFAKTGNLLASPWKFKRYGECGHHVSDLFPNVAQHVDDLCFIHSMHGTNPAHGAAVLKLHTGSDNFIRPSMGSWVSYGLGTENDNLPSYVSICPTLAHGGAQNWGSAFLPSIHQGCPIGNASVDPLEAKVRHISNVNHSFSQQRAQIEMIRSLNGSNDKWGMGSSAWKGRIKNFEMAYKMQTSVPLVQDISGESKAIQSLYGIDKDISESFGHQCLMARRFLEQGVRFVQVTHSALKAQWDQHGNLRRDHAERAAQVDKPIAGLLADLKSRGMLEDTLVIWAGEFGRTPTVQGPKFDGRDHNPHGFTIWLAGAGVKPGFSYGSTDEFGYYAEETPVHVHDFHATLLAFMGIDHEELTYHFAGRDFRLTDVHGRVIQDIFS